MKKFYLFLVFSLVAICFVNRSTAQIVGTSAFIKGAYTEIGMQGNGSFGVVSGAPAGYHPHPGTALAEVYDYGHDGWAVGTPAYMGDYTYPGSPFEGWEVQVNGGRTQGYQGTGTGYSFSGGGTMAGSGITSWSSVGGVAKANWAGTVSSGNLAMRSETRVDTLGSAVTVTVYMHNTSAAAIPGVYYWRSCDPDNDQSWPGGAFNTNNVINFQNTTIPNPDHKVMVTATGTSATLPPLTLCTKDCRAVAVIYNSWGLTVTQDLGAVWNQTYGGAFYNVGANHPGDIGIGIVWNIGIIQPGDSATLSYSYVFNGVPGIDDPGALPDPLLSVAGIIAPATVPPNPTIDTYNVCLHPGMTSCPVDILNASDRAWAFSHWTWSPATGLSATTGVSVIITTTALPPVITYTITGTDTATCKSAIMYLTLITCNTTQSNTPCYGDTLLLRRIGDSTGCTYFWYHPGSGFTSTLQNPFKFPATYADSGYWYVVRTYLGVHDTDSTKVTIHYKPDITASNNAPLCAGMVDTLLLYTTPTIPGLVYNWIGPVSFTSTLQNPTRPGYVYIDTGDYYVFVNTSFGCKDTAHTFAGMIPQPAPPIVGGPRTYCQNDVFSPFTVAGLVPGGRIRWYINNSVVIGDTLATTPSVITAVPGITTVYFSQRSGNCESPRDSFKVKVIPTPSAPVVTGTMQYCQFIGPVDTFTLAPSGADSFAWYFVATGGSPTFTKPTPNITVVPSGGGTYNYWVSRIDSGCESPRTPVVVTIHPKPSPPIIVPTPICQFMVPVPVKANKSGPATDVLTWYGPGVTPGSNVAPTIPTNVAPDTTYIYVTETTIYGCVSDSALDKHVIKVKPPVPVTRETKYCQHANANPLNGLVDSLSNSHLNWFALVTPLNPTPVPVTDTTPGTYTWYVSQTVPNDATGCKSDSTPVHVTIIYKPVFDIHVSAPFVCQFDSLMLSYCCGPQLFAPGYTWTLPPGSKLAAGNSIYDSMITVQFNSSNNDNYVYLRASDDSGFCYTDDTVRINVVKQPDMNPYIQPNICLNDTVDLALAIRSGSAYDFKWYIDDTLLPLSNAINLISGNAHSGGPFSLRWVEAGRHIIKVTSVSQEGCKSLASFDSVNVRPQPDASFEVLNIPHPDQLCLEDSVQFGAIIREYGYSYAWTPEHYFNNLNSPIIWGRMESLKSNVTLTITDPFGCYSTKSMLLEPQTCCSVIFPNAFTPNADLHNNVFRPIFSGFHRFHTFRIVNRWGITVFEGGNSDVKWDGTYNGVPQDMGTYFYYLKYDCGGKTLEAKGDVTLIR